MPSFYAARPFVAPWPGGCPVPAQPLPERLSQLRRLVRRRETQATVVRREGVVSRLTMTALGATSATFEADNVGSPLDTQLALRRAEDGQTTVFALPGGPGRTVPTELFGLQPNSQYSFTVESRFQYASGGAYAAMRTYTATDPRNLPAVLTFWTHGPPTALEQPSARLVRWTGVHTNRGGWPGLARAREPAAPVTEDVEYYIRFEPEPDAAPMQLDFGPLGRTFFYLPADLVNNFASCTVEARYVVDGYYADTYFSEPLYKGGGLAPPPYDPPRSAGRRGAAAAWN